MDKTLAIEKVLLKKDKNFRYYKTEQYGNLVPIGISTDMGWQKPDKNYGSPSGSAYAIGLESTKILDYALMINQCHSCDRLVQLKKSLVSTS